MLRSAWRCLTVVAALLAASAARAGEVTPLRKTLEPAVLSAPEAVLCPQDLCPPQQVRLQDGTVLPQMCSYFRKDQNQHEQRGVLAGVPYTLIWNAGTAFSFQQGGAPAHYLPQELKAVQALQTFPGLTARLGRAEIVLPGPRKYTLAFPLAWAMGGTGAGVFIRPGFVQKCELDGQELAFYDDGATGSFIQGQVSYRAGPPNAPVCLFAPMKELVCDNQKVYRVQALAEDGSEVTLTPYVGAAGRIAAAVTSGPLEVYAVLSSPASGLHAVVGPGASEVCVVPGVYAVAYGLLYDTATKRLVAGIGPSQPAALTVTEGKTVEVKFGAPFRFALNAVLLDHQIVVESSGVKLLGQGGETYVAYDNTDAPSVSLLWQNEEIPLGKMQYG